MHTDPELLALLALGEQAGTEEERRHAQTCPACAAEVAELHEVAVLARAAGPFALSEPSARVWVAITDEIRSGRPAASLDGREPTAHVALAPVEQAWARASGEAELATDSSGRRLLRLTLHADLPRDGVRQAWLLHRDDPAQRQTLGILDGQHGLWTVDHAIDLAAFSILDVSQQSIGSTEHSGRSIVRGELVQVA